MLMRQRRRPVTLRLRQCALLSERRTRLDDWQIWVNPDCGLKIPNWEEGQAGAGEPRRGSATATRGMLREGLTPGTPQLGMDPWPIWRRSQWLSRGEGWAKQPRLQSNRCEWPTWAFAATRPTFAAR
jgi:hypothetical protein